MNLAEPVTQNDLDDLDDRRGHKSEAAYRTISEVAADMNLPQHVLRFWESKFKQISPLKRGGGRRYYRPQDIDLIKRIHYLLHTQGYTIKGVQKLLSKDRLLQNSVPTLTGTDTARVSVDEAIQRPVANTVAETPSAAVAETNQADLHLLLNRLKTLRTQMAARV